MDSVQGLWVRRDLVMALATSEFKGRYRRLGLGVAWAVVNPLVQAALIAVVFDRLLPGRFDVGVPYALFVLAGIMAWNFFASAVAAGTGSILDHAAIVQRVAIPRAALPTASLLTALFNLGFMLATLAGIVLVMAPGRLGRIWLLPAAVILQALLVFGITLLAAPLHVRYRDLGNLIQAGTLALFWATPVAYPMSVLSSLPALRAAVRANPMTGVVSLYRAAFLHLPVDGVAVAWTIGWTAAFLLAGWAVFSRREDTIADFI